MKKLGSSAEGDRTYRSLQYMPIYLQPTQLAYMAHDNNDAPDRRGFTATVYINRGTVRISPTSKAEAAHHLQHRVLASQSQLPHAHHHGPSWATSGSATSTATNPPRSHGVLASPFVSRCVHQQQHYCCCRGAAGPMPAIPGDGAASAQTLVYCHRRLHHGVPVMEGRHGLLRMGGRALR
jgi:hypothetical protein